MREKSNLMGEILGDFRATWKEKVRSLAALTRKFPALDLCREGGISLTYRQDPRLKKRNKKKMEDQRCQWERLKFSCVPEKYIKSYLSFLLACPTKVTTDENETKVETL